MGTSIMKSMLQKFFLAALFLAATTLAMEAQENSGGTINTLSVNPRQNLELRTPPAPRAGSRMMWSPAARVRRMVWFRSRRTWEAQAATAI